LNAPVGWWWLVVAALAALVAVGAGSSVAVAAPAATVAVVAAVLAVLETVVRPRRARRGSSAYYDPGPTRPGGLREAFIGGAPGREDLVLACDRLDRALSRPNLRARTTSEIHAILALPPDEFRRYLSRRLAELEAAS